MFVELQEKYQDKHFTVLGITTDDSPDDDLASSPRHTR